MKREAASTMDPRSLFFSSGSSAAQPLAPPPPSSSTSDAVESRGLVAPAGGQPPRHAGSISSSISSTSSSPNLPPAPLQYGQHPPPPPLTSPQGTAPHPSSFGGGGGQGSFYSSSAPTELYQSPPQAIGYTPSTAFPLTASFPGSTGGGGGTGGKVRKGKDRAARPVLGLRVKSEDNSVSTTNQDASKTRAQYSACGGCRMRRVKCDLHDIKLLYRTNILPNHLSLLLSHPNSQAISDNGGYELVNGELVGLDGCRIACTNCRERGLRCVDGLAAKELGKNPSTSPTLGLSLTSPTLPTGPILSASGKPKMLRKGKRIAMVQNAFGGTPSTTTSSSSNAVGSRNVGSRRTTVSSLEDAGSVQTDESTTRSPEIGLVEELERSEAGEVALTGAFFHSPFFKRFVLQRPLIDLEEFEHRYFSSTPGSASNLTPVGSILFRVLFAWARSFGVDAAGNEDSQPMTAEVRSQRKKECDWIVSACLREIDREGVMRKPSWEGVQTLFLLLPLTEDTSSPMERLGLYECAISQLVSLSSHGTVGYERNLAFDPVGPRAQSSGHDLMSQIRLFWYGFIHEGIKTGLKGGRLLMSEDDLNDFQASISNLPFSGGSSSYPLISQLGSSPIRLALACRLVHRALTGPKARKSAHVDSPALHEAWSIIDSCWEEFDSLRNKTQLLSFISRDDLHRFCDGWMIFLFECHSVIREALYERFSKLLHSPRSDVSREAPPPELEINRLHAISEGKCVAMARSMITIIWRNLGGPLFKFDAGLVRDGTYYTACVLATDSGSVEEMNCCLTALSDMRWAFSKAEVRLDHVKAIWKSRLDQEAPVQHKTPSVFASPHTSPYAQTTTHQRPGMAPRNVSYQSEHSDTSYQSEQYTPAFYNNEDVHLPPIQGHFAGQRSPVPPTLLRGLNIADETIQETPMWTDNYSPMRKQVADGSGTSTPSGYLSVVGNSPVQTMSSLSSARPSRLASDASNPYLSPSSAFDNSTRTSPLVAPHDFFQNGATSTYQSTPETSYDHSPSVSSASAFRMSEQYLASPHQAGTETFAPYGDDEPSETTPSGAEQSAPYTEFYPGTT